MELYRDDFNSELKTNLHSMTYNISNWIRTPYLTTYNRDGFPVPYWFNLFNFTPINRIILSNNKLYLKQEHLDLFIKEDNEIPYPDFLDTTNFTLNSGVVSGTLQFNFINTTSGKIIYKILDKFAAETQTTGYFNFKLEKLEELSAAFKISNNHNIAMYKFGNKLIVASNIIDHELIWKIVGFFPFIFNIEINPIIKDFIAAKYSDKSLVPYEEGIRNLINTASTEQLKTVIRTTISNNIDRMLVRKRDTIDSCRRSIKDYTQSIEGLYRDLAKCSLEYESLLLQKANMNESTENQTNSFVDYLLRLKHVKVHEVRANYNKLLLKFEVPLTSYDPEACERILKSLNRQAEDENYKRVIRALQKILLEEEYNMTISAIVVINFEDRQIYVSQNDRNGYTTLYNPHLYHFNCWGDNSSRIYDALSKGELETMVNFISMAVQNINFTDITVINRWIRTLESEINEIPAATNFIDMKSIKDTDGIEYTLREIIEIIEKEGEDL